MALFDSTWFTGLQTAATTVGGIIAGAMAGALLVWRNFSKTRSAVAMEGNNAGWVTDIRTERSEALKSVGELTAELRQESRKNGRLEAELAGARDMVRELQERITEYMDGRDKLASACEERNRSLAEQLLDQKMANGRLLIALSAADKDAAERLLQEHLQPASVAKGSP